MWLPTVAAFFATIQFMGPLRSTTEGPAPALPAPATRLAAAATTTTPSTASTTATPHAASPAPAPAADARLEAVVDAVQKTYDGTTSFRGRFTQKYTLTMLRRTQESSGNVVFEKPGRMRWDYDKPTPKSFIVDTTSLWIVQPVDKVAYVNACFQQDALTASVAFLFGQGKLREQFTVSSFDAARFGDAGDHQLLLVPRQNNTVFARLILVVDPKTYRVKQSVVVDPAGNVNQFVYSDLVFNQPIGKGTFSYTPTADIHASRMPGTCNQPVAGVR